MKVGTAAHLGGQAAAIGLGQVCRPIDPAAAAEARAWQAVAALPAGRLNVRRVRRLQPTAAQAASMPIEIELLPSELIDAANADAAVLAALRHPGAVLVHRIVVSVAPALALALSTAPQLWLAGEGAQRCLLACGGIGTVAGTVCCPLQAPPLAFSCLRPVFETGRRVVERWFDEPSTPQEGAGPPLQ
jgi:hypothetical protein